MNMVLGNVTESVTCVAVDEETEEGTFKVNNRMISLMGVASHCRDAIDCGE